MNKKMIGILGIVVMVAIISACSAPSANSNLADNKPAEPGSGGNVAIQMKGFAFNPKEVSIKVGTKVTWTNMDSAGHDVKAADGSWGSDTMNQNQTFSKVFDKVGTFPYVCTFHSGMSGTITVTP